MNILLVDDDNMVRDALSQLIKLKGFEVTEAVNGRLGLELYQKESFDLVISDIQMPEMDGFELLEAIRKEDSDTIVIMITAMDTMEAAIKALRLGANNFIRKPCSAPELLNLLQKYDEVTTDHKLTHQLDGMVEHQSLRCKIDNRIEMSAAAACYLASHLGSQISCSQRLDIVLGLTEMITNAIEHGNMEITSEEKEAALMKRNGIGQLYEDRQNDSRLADRRVTIDFTMKHGKTLEWRIQDEGKGFNPGQVADPMDECNQMRSCGRGIFLSRMIFDEISYENGGTLVYLRKNLDSDGCD